MHSWKTPLLGLALVAAPLLGCEEEPAATETPAPEGLEAEPPQAEGDAPEAEAATEPAGPRVEQEGYKVELSGPDGASAGELTQLALVVEGRGEWHLNQDFPFGVDVQVPEGVQLPKASFGKADAASFADEGARVEVPITPTAAGEHTVQAEVRFAICNPQSCIPKTETVALELRVE